MKTDFYLKLQQKYGGMWVATSKSGRSVYAANRDVDSLYKKLTQKKIKPQQTVIGYIEKPNTVHVYVNLSLSLQTYPTRTSR